ncbi:MAG: type II toxin-antitoxin system VapC family toxin [Acidobacteria bacterium]|nr:type II toxin-antitoxin system VapC family toxin [Acidobacteriota bacterium]
MIVLDASAAVDLLLDTQPFSGAIACRLREHEGDLHAPHLLDAEVAQVFRRYVLRGELSVARARLGLLRLSQMPLVRYPHGPFLERALALRENLTVYDALYLALAEALGAALLTRDGGLAAAPGARATVTVVS